MASYLRKFADTNGDHAVPANAPPGEWGGLWPALYEFLVSISWEDGSARIPGTLTIFTEGNLWKACLSDKAQARVAFVTADDPEQLLQHLEDGLVRAVLDWRPTQRWAEQKKRK